MWGNLMRSNNVQNRLPSRITGALALCEARILCVLQTLLMRGRSSDLQSVYDSF